LSLTNVKKLNHLNSCLTDDALGTARAFKVSERNFEKALASLINVYDKKCFIFFDTIPQL